MTNNGRPVVLIASVSSNGSRKLELSLERTGIRTFAVHPDDADGVFRAGSSLGASGLLSG